MPIRRAPGSAEDSRIVCTLGAARFFSFDRLPSNWLDRLGALPPGWLEVPVAKVPRGQKYYRIALRGERWGSKPRSVRFGLCERPVQATLQVLAEHLDAVDAPWVWLCNEHGNRLSTGAFCSKQQRSAA